MDTLEYRPLHTVDDAALILGTRTRLYEALRAGDIKAKKIGRRTMILGESLRAYVEALPDATFRRRHHPETAAQ